MSDCFIKGVVRQGEYYDSVTLMRLAQKLSELPGVIDSAAIMGTDSNKMILSASGMMTDDLRAARDNDLLIIIKAESDDIAGKIDIDKMLSSLKDVSTTKSGRVSRTIAAALQTFPDANLAIISVAGRFAGAEAKRALEAGLHVMLFSDNVPLETEIELKRLALSKGLLVMGPDCGTAIINGVPLGFANGVKRGEIGIVAASGTGLQEVSCIIANQGAGVSQAIGTGSRDLSAEVGGIMFIESIKALTADSATKTLLLVSKPPALETLKKIDEILKSIVKPVVAVFLGTEHKDIDKIIFASSLEESALKAVAISRGENPNDVTAKISQRDRKFSAMAHAESVKLNRSQRYLRGLFSGGTFCYEAQVLLKAMSDIYSNSPITGNCNLSNYLNSEKHTLIDMGADEFTLGRLHPMIDFSLREKRIAQEANDPETAVILLDIVLGYGANKNPLDDITPAIKEAQEISKKSQRHLPIICSVTGTENDPQNQSKVIEGLQELGVMVLESNAAACRLAGHIVQEMAGLK